MDIFCSLQRNKVYICGIGIIRKNHCGGCKAKEISESSWVWKVFILLKSPQARKRDLQRLLGIGAIGIPVFEIRVVHKS